MQQSGPPDDIHELRRSYEEMLGRAEGMELGAGTAGPPTLQRIIEALLFVGGPPLNAARVGEVLRGLTEEQLQGCIESLNRAYRQQGRPYRIQPRDQGYQLVLHGSFRSVADRLQGSLREARLSPAALDVLALVAYQQPVTRAEIETARGAESSSTLRLLVRLGLIVVQRGEESTRETRYATTRRFLELFQLRSLDELPRTQELQQM